MKRIAALLICLMIAACGTKGPVRGSQEQIAALAFRLQSLSADVDPAEAREAARLTYETTHQLAIAYEIRDPALIHNAKVNAGIKPRGLCYHWAEDLQAQLDQAGFKTLATARAIANSETSLLIDHSTTILTAIGAPMESGVVVDPWRYGGRLFWAPVVEDTRYDWKPREDVLRAKGLIRYAQRTPGSVAAPPAQ